MTTRISTSAANTQIVNILLRTQQRLNTSEIQVASEEVSQNYQGLSRDSERLINLENTRDLLNRYKQGNDTQQLRLTVGVDALEILRQQINEFRQDLSIYSQSTVVDLDHVSAVQESAFRSMKAIEAYLNTEVDGTFLFAGSRNQTEPVNFTQSNLSEFQTTYDGTTITYPETRTDALFLRLTAAGGNATNPNGAGYGTVTFAGAGTMTATTVGAFRNIPVGATITTTGAAIAGNNGTFTVTANTGTAITVTPNSLVAEASVAVTLAADTSYYSGDTVPATHRVSTRQEFTNSLNGIDPAFEKAIRAMGIIAQGVFGTAGGLDQNAARVDQARFLIDSALFSTANGTPPFGAEQTGSIEAAETRLGFSQVLIARTNEAHTQTIGLLELRVGAIENVDLLAAITSVTDDARTLEASFQTIARIRSLSLQDFLR